MSWALKKILFILFLSIFGLSVSSWELHYPEGQPQAQIYKTTTTFNKKKLKSTPPPYDYGDRTQLSAFILCLFLGYVSAHHFYLKNRKIAFIQLSFFILTVLGFASLNPIGAFLGSLLGLTLFTWVLIDLLLICFRSIRPKSRRPLIPWD
jgi:hypothetical protein